MNATVKSHGVNGLTRANLLAALNHIHKFDADGIIGPIDLASRTISDCHVLSQVSNGTFVRVQPTKPGTFDCNPNYVITRKLDLTTAGQGPRMQQPTASSSQNRKARGSAPGPAPGRHQPKYPTVPPEGADRVLA